MKINEIVVHNWKNNIRIIDCTKSVQFKSNFIDFQTNH